jgi:hypothetical protein
MGLYSDKVQERMGKEWVKAKGRMSDFSDHVKKACYKTWQDSRRVVNHGYERISQVMEPGKGRPKN